MSVAVMQRAPDAAAEAARERRRQQWLERAAKELATADSADPDRPPETLCGHLDRMVESATESDALERADKADIRGRVRAAKLGLYERHVDCLLDQAMAAARDKDGQQTKNELLKQINAAFSLTVRLGTSDAVKESIKARLAIIRETSAAGESAKAKKDAEREAGRREASHPGERRTFTRWRDPPLVVVIGNRCFTTADWSLSGILIDEFDLEGRKPGDQLDIQVGLSRDRLYKERIEIVRISTEPPQVAVRSRRFASVLMQVKRDCELQDLDPN